MSRTILSGHARTLLKLRTEQLYWLLGGIDIEAMRVRPTGYFQRVT
ncbi:hypothetical protein PQR05_37190 [Paraburkholderia sediminicola]